MDGTHASGLTGAQFARPLRREELGMDAQWWLVWLAVALVAGVIEIFTLSLVFAMVLGGALAAAAVAGLTGSATASVLAFAVSTGLLLLVVRPPLLRYAKVSGPPASTGVAALVGRRAEVLRAVTTTGGEVKLAGEVWTARAASPGQALETGSIVFVSRIDGATAVVTPLPPDLPTDPAALPGADTPTERPEN
jgi:membrane protein implicated in regulation of membrane protease activity